MKIALFQMNIDWENKEKNFKKLESVMSKVIERRCKGAFFTRDDVYRLFYEY